MNTTMPGIMPQGSQIGTMQQPVNMPGFQPQYPAVPGIGSVPMNRPRTIPGRMIYSPDEIMPQEVPMDGSVSLFPMHDWSCVYGKWWTSNGQIQIDESAVSLSDISERLNKVERYLFKNKHKQRPNQNEPVKVEEVPHPE